MRRVDRADERDDAKDTLVLIRVVREEQQDADTHLHGQAHKGGVVSVLTQ